MSEPPLDALLTDLAGRYEFEREIAVGGMAAVYLVHDLKHQRRVALKVMKSALDGSGTQRFLREIGVTARLSHPHILPLLDSGEAGGLPFYVMPFVDGETLRDRISRDVRLKLGDALHIATEVADALAYAHAQGIVHRDIKPANILLSGRHAVVADFGVARALASHLDPSVALDDPTQVGVAVGTVAYMSPEQAAGESQLDGRSDIFSLGVVLYEMLAGEQAFGGGTLQEQLTRRFTGPIPSVRARRAEIPESIDAVLAMALAADPARRFPSAAEFETAIRAAVDGRLGSAETGAIHVGRESASIPSVAVLPLENLSGDPENNHLSDGITEEILTQLALRRTMRVCARVSSFAYRDRRDDARTIGARLGVQHLLLGSMQRAGNRLRVNVQLVNSATGFEVWSERFDRQLEDVFAIQDEIGVAVANALDANLVGRVTEPPPKPAPRFEVYEALLRGRYLWNRRTAGDTTRALESYQQALALDPDYAPAHAGIAEALVTQAVYGAMPPLEAMPRARRAAEMALERDPSLAEARGVLAQVTAAFEWNWQEAEALFRQAIALNPQLPSAFQGLAMLCLTPQRRHAEALDMMQRALRLDPLSPVLRATLSSLHLYAGRPDASRDTARSVIELEPGFALAHYFLSQSLLALGEHDGALAHAGQAVTLSGRSGETVAVLGHVHATRGDHVAARVLLQELEERGKVAWISPSYRALLHTALGEHARALDLLDEAVARRAADLVWLAVRPAWAPLSGEPRFQALLRVLHLQETTASP